MRDSLADLLFCGGEERGVLVIAWLLLFVLGGCTRLHLPGENDKWYWEGMDK